jgi:hypothetical protein
MNKSNILKLAKAISAINAKTDAKVLGLVKEQAEITTKNCQSFVDMLTIECDKKSKAEYWKTAKDDIALFVETAWNDESKRKSYKTSLKIAFVHGVEFGLSLFKTHSPVDGQPKGEKDSQAKAGGVTTTTPESAEKTARKLIAQLRLLGKNSVAALILDAMIEFNPEFKESAE